MSLEDFRTTIRNKIINEFIAGSRNFLLWGLNPVCIELIADLRALGLLQYVHGIIDSDFINHKDPTWSLPVLPPSKVPEMPLDTLVVLENGGKERVLRQFLDVDKRMPKIILAGSDHFAFDDNNFIALLQSNPVKSKAGGYPNMRTHIYQCVKHLVNSGQHGAIAEFGAYRCGTSIFISRLLHSLGKKERIIAFDTFGAYPPRKHVLDIFSSRKCECPDFNEVKRNADNFGVELVRGDICETVHLILGVPLMFTFFDTDNYSPTKAALDICYEQTIKGGILAFDHFFSEQWVDTIGERMAVNELLAEKPLLNLHGTGIFIKM